MAEVTILVCEWCQKTPVVRLTLLGQKTKLLLDFCAKDHKKFMKFIQPRQRQKAGVTHAASKRKQFTAQENDEVRRNIMALLGKTDKLAPGNMSKTLRVPIWRINPALKVLIKEGKIAKNGRGRGVSYRRK
jgi:hypothetical protein